MTSRRLIAALVFGVAAIPALAQGSCRGVDILAELKTQDPGAYQAIETTAKSTRNGEAILWRVQKPGVADSHLFGTIHLTDPRVTKLSPGVAAAFAQSSLLALEVESVDPAATAAAMQRAGPIGFYTDGRKLDEALSAAEMRTVNAVLREAQMPAADVVPLRPWIVMLLLATSTCERQAVQSGVRVLDARLAERAASQKIKVVGLESIEGQLQAIARLPEAEQIGMLRAGIAYAGRRDDLLETLVGMYLGRKIGMAWPLQVALAARAGVTPEAFAGFHREVIVGRNAKMRDAALPHLAAGGAFIAVGALHLVGDDGLVELLRQAGYTVTAVE